MSSGIAAQETTLATNRPDSVAAFSLLSFTVSTSNGQNIFAWKTDSRSLFTHFILERSNDRNQFTAISDINQPVASKTNSFTYIESKPAAGRTYYRLKMTDSSGAVTYSTIISVNNTPFSNLQIQYEAGSGMIAISGATTGNTYQLKLYNCSGQMLLQKTVSADQPAISISQFAHGLYVIYVTDGITAPVSRKIIW